MKHGGGQERLNIDELELADATPDEKLLLVDEALAQLEVEHPERARVVVLKYFGGMTNKEVAGTLGIERTHGESSLGLRQSWLFEQNPRAIVIRLF